MKKELALYSILLINSTVVAQWQESKIDEVVIQGKFIKTSYKDAVENVTVITKTDIERNPAASIDDLLQQYASMDIRRRGGMGVQSDISIRGSSFEQVLILINGIRMNDSQTGHNSFNIPIDMSSVERVEIIKGPAARRYGQNAYGGVINIITQTTATESVKISTEVGDYSTLGLGFHATFGSDDVKNLLQINRSQSNGYRYNTDFEQTNIFLQSDMVLGRGILGIHAGFSQKDFGANGFYASPQATNQYEELQASVVALTYQQKFNKLNLYSAVSWRRGQDMYVYNRYNPAIYRNMHIGHNAGFEANVTYQSFLGTTGLGIELRKDFLTSNNLGKRDRLLSQAFLEHEFSFFNDKLKVIPGVTLANIGEAGNFWYPGIDVGYKFSRNHKFFANAAKVHRVPTFTDLYYTSLTEKGNPNLTPESALAYELGYEYSRENFNFKTSVFLRDTENMIDWSKNDVNDIWEANNVTTVKTSGFELEGKYKIRSISSQLSASYTYLDNSFNNENKLSRYTAENLRHQVITSIQTTFAKRFTNTLTYRYLERVSTAGYQLLDEKLSFRAKSLELFVLINNITNVSYAEVFGIPMPGRWFHVGMSYTIQ